MEYCITFSAINMAGPRITLILRSISPDPLPGMRRSGIPGINAILITGRVLNSSIPIGAAIASVSVMIKSFIISTIMARGEVGIKDSRAGVLPQFLALGCINRHPMAPDLKNPDLPVLERIAQEPLPLAFTREPLVLACILLGQLLPASVLMYPPVLAVLASVLLGFLPREFRNLEPMALASVALGPRVRERIKLRKILGVRKERRSSFLIGAGFQIAPAGRSGSILLPPERSAAE